MLTKYYINIIIYFKKNTETQYLIKTINKNRKKYTLKVTNNNCNIK